MNSAKVFNGTAHKGDRIKLYGRHGVWTVVGFCSGGCDGTIVRYFGPGENDETHYPGHAFARHCVLVKDGETEGNDETD